MWFRGPDTGVRWASPYPGAGVRAPPWRARGRPQGASWRCRPGAVVPERRAERARGGHGGGAARARQSRVVGAFW